MSINSHRLQWTLLLFAFAVLAAGSLALWLQKARPYAFPDAPQGKLACVSYTPRSDSTASTVQSVHAQIEIDLKQLATRSRCVRTYSVMNGLDYVPTAARKFGLRVLLGFWVSANSEANELELTRAIEVAKANKDVIDAVIVGNEVLLRREQKAEALSDMLTRVRTATNLPVTYADVWDFWIKNPQLAKAASFVTIHILPYWEDEPVGVDKALQHVIAIYDKVQRAFPNERIFLGETGWPSAGRQREAAAPSRINQARFFREFIAYASAHDLAYNFIEAYDQPWKRRLEGAVGGYWGVYDSKGHEKFPLAGPVEEDSTWRRGPIAAAATGLLFLMLAAVFRWPHSWPGYVLWFFGGLSAGAIGVQQWDYLWQANRNEREWLAMAAWTLSGLGVSLFALKQLAQSTTHSTRFSRWLRLGFLFGAAYVSVGLSFDPRYRGFPTIFIALPAFASLALSLVETSRAVRTLPKVEDTLLAWCLLLSAPWIAFNEGWVNLSALGWCVGSALLALSVLAPFIVQAREDKRAQQQAHGRPLEVVENDARQS